MPHHARPRSGGRHRREGATRPRHRASSSLPAILTGERARAVSVTAALGAALAVGIAGGTAAAATHRAAPASPQPSPDATKATGPASPTGTRIATDPASPAHDATTSAEAEAEATRPPRPGTTVRTGGDAEAPTPAVTAAKAAEAVRRKPRPKPAAPAARKVTTSAWVDPNPSARVTSCFGPRWGRMHEGVDLAAPNGTPIVAAGAGIVARAGVAEGYGNAVLIDHGNGYLTHYGHLSAITVTPGQHVTAGQQIGNEGSTGHSTGPHLHFEVHRGLYPNPVEPTAWMRAHGVDIPGCA